MHIGAFVEEMEQLAPPDLAEEFDAGRIGLIVEGKPEVQRICCALDATEAVIRKAVSAGADLLVVHHTPIWNPLTQLSAPTTRIIKPLLSHDMNLYVMHTNFDRAEGGVNDVLARVLGLTNVDPLSIGRIGSCSLTVSGIQKRLSCPLRVWGRARKISRLALVAGSGFDPALLQEAAAAGADAFLSAELKHSVARNAPIPCIEATHYALEAPAMRDLADRMGWIYLDDPPELSVLP